MCVPKWSEIIDHSTAAALHNGTVPSRQRYVNLTGSGKFEGLQSSVSPTIEEEESKYHSFLVDSTKKLNIEHILVFSHTPYIKCKFSHHSSIVCVNSAAAEGRVNLAILSVPRRKV